MFDKTEEEQIQAIKDWFSKNYLWLAGLIVAVSSSYFGWNFWQESMHEDQVHASSLYSDVQGLAYAVSTETDSSKQDGLLEDMLASRNTIVGLYSDSIYADLSRQVYASTLARLGQLEEASEELEFLVASKDRLIQNNSLIAFAKVRWQQGNTEGALALLARVEEGFTAMARELEGDIYLSENRIDEAKAAYEQAIDMQTIPNSLLQMKLNYVSK